MCSHVSPHVFVSVWSRVFVPCTCVYFQRALLAHLEFVLRCVFNLNSFQQQQPHIPQAATCKCVSCTFSADVSIWIQNHRIVNGVTPKCSPSFQPALILCYPALIGLFAARSRQIAAEVTLKMFPLVFMNPSSSELHETSHSLPFSQLTVSQNSEE